MKKLPALMLSLALTLTACGAPSGADRITTLPTDHDEILVETGLRASDLPEVCRSWFDVAETSGAAEKNSGLPLAARAEEGVGSVYGVRMPDGSYTDLILEGKLDEEGVTLREFSDGGARQEGSYGQLAWNGELYHALTITAQDCAIPNLNAVEGGMLRLNISGDCTLSGGGAEWACLENFACVLLTGDGTLTVSDTSGLGCGGSDLPLPALMLDGNVTLRCENVMLTPNSGAPALVQLGGTLCAEQLWVNGGELVNAGGTLFARNVHALAGATFRGGVSIFDTIDAPDASSPTLVLSGGEAWVSDPLPQGTGVEGGAGALTAPTFSGVTVNEYGAELREGEQDGSAYLATDYSEDWAGQAVHAAWDGTEIASAAGRWFAGMLTMDNGSAPELQAWGALHLNLRGENTVEGDLAGTGLLITGDGSLRVSGVNIWGWGDVHAPLLAIRDGVSVRCGELHMGSNAEEMGELLLESGSLTVDGGELWLQNARLSVQSGELHATGAVSVERGEVRFSGGTVTLEQGLWLGEGDIVIDGGTVIVPGGEAGLVAESGSVRVLGGEIREA